MNNGISYYIKMFNSIGSTFIGVKDNNEKLLVKSEDEYTSPVNKIYQVNEEYIITTENSLYIVSNKIGTKRIE